MRLACLPKGALFIWTIRTTILMIVIATVGNQRCCFWNLRREVRVRCATLRTWHQLNFSFNKE